MAPPWSIARDRLGDVMVSTIDLSHGLLSIAPEYEVYRSDTQDVVRFDDRAKALARHAEIVAELQRGVN